MMMDLHCHLDLYKDPFSVVREIVRKNIFVLSVTTTPSAFDRTSSISSNQKFIATGIGLHPQLVHQRSNEAPQINNWIEKTDFVGEIGLDGGKEYSNSWHKQLDVFKYALDLSSNHGGRILSIHSRRAASSVLDCIEKNSNGNTPILHWFSGSIRELKRAVDLGCWFSVGPAMLAGKKGKELLSEMPKDRVLLETDGPFTTLKGEPYYPWDAEMYCAPIISREWLMSESDIRLFLQDNLNRLLIKRHVTV